MLKVGRSSMAEYIFSSCKMNIRSTMTKIPVRIRLNDDRKKKHGTLEKGRSFPLGPIIVEELLISFTHIQNSLG